jgi:hypothetical protein
MSAALDLVPIICPHCSRILGASDHTSGRVGVYCKSCGEWQLVNLADEPRPRHDRWQPNIIALMKRIRQ